MLRARLIPDKLVKGLAIYEHADPRPETHGPDAVVKVEQLNYTALKTLREVTA